MEKIIIGIGIGLGLISISLAIYFKPMPNIEANIKAETFNQDTQVRSIACYNLDGTGPLSKCKTKIRCYSKKGTNGSYYKVDCPMFVEGSDN